ncbi:MAG: Uma2 family endonuclease [Myxococcota bacterium]|nr:Uma2 family endonuclease [Myxococcota bacterium]
MDPADKKKRATYQDVLDAPEHKVAEIIGGELHLSPRPGAPHARVATVIGHVLSQFDGGSAGPGGWTFLFEPELHFGDDIVIPDLAGWREARMPLVPNDPFVTLAPDWICEVISDSTEKRDRMKKMPIYATAGIDFAWLVHPKYRSIEVFRRQGDGWLTVTVHDDPARTARIMPFDAVELDLARLWAKTPLPTRASDGSMYYEYEKRAP